MQFPDWKILYTLIKTLLKFVHEGLIDIKQALVHLGTEYAVKQ